MINKIKKLPLLVRQLMVILVLCLLFMVGIMLVFGEFTTGFEVLMFLGTKVVGVVILVIAFGILRGILPNEFD